MYEALSKSGCLVHPSQRTLRDYSLAVKAEVGFADGQLMMAANKIEEWEQLVVILLEEMYIKELREINNHLLAFEQSLNEKSALLQELS